MCACGGVSQYRETRAAPAADEGTTEQRSLSWEAAMAELWRRYVEP
jgi:hypothetical protein